MADAARAHIHVPPDENSPDEGAADVDAAGTDLSLLAERLDALELAVAKVLSEANQTGDFVRQAARTLGESMDAIRSEAISESRQALTRAHSAVALARMAAEAEDEEALTAVLRRIEGEVDAELAFVGIVPLIPAVGDPIDTKMMRTRGPIPDGIDPDTAAKTVERVSSCGYQFPDHRVLPFVTVRWEPVGAPGTEAPPET